jgi:hypothetical protein
MRDECARIEQYLKLIDRKQRISFHPAIVGAHDSWEYAAMNGTHLRIRNTSEAKDYYVPCAMIEFISPANGDASVIRLRREMRIVGETIV